MRSFARLVTAMSVATLVVLSGCGESSSLTAPQARSQEQESALLGGLLGGLTSLLVSPVERSTPLANDITWSFTVGPAGATSSNAASGLTIRVPAYAVSSTTTITVTALAGSAVAYSFSPHGLEFNRDVILTQSLVGTNVGLLSLPFLSGAYFGTDELEINGGGLAEVLEVIPATVSLLSRKASFPIEHFSGYILASGRGSRSDGQ